MCHLRSGAKKTVEKESEWTRVGARGLVFSQLSSDPELVECSGDIYDTNPSHSAATRALGSPHQA